MFPGSTKAAVERPQRAAGRPPDHRADPREAAGQHRIRQREEGRQDRRAAGAAPAQRVPDERRQHPAGRRGQGGAALHRAAGAAGRQLPVRVSDGGGAALQQPAVRAGATPSGWRSRCCARAWRRTPASSSRSRSTRRWASRKCAPPPTPSTSRKRDGDQHADIALAAHRRARQQPRLRARLPPGRREDRVGPDALQGPRRERRELLPRDGRAAQVRGRRTPSRRATTSSWSTSRARCTAFRWTPPRCCWSG